MPLAETVRKKLREYLGIPQNRLERLAHFDQAGKGRKPLELNYEYDQKFWEDKKHKRHDIVNKETTRGRHEQKKEELNQLPEIEKRSQHKARKKARRNTTDKI